MDKETKAALKKEITDVEEWMRESADIYYKAYSLEEMQKNSNDAGEIILTFYLNSGKEIEVHNHCARSYISGDYEGDTLIIGDEGVNIEIYHRYNKSLFFYYIPYSAISHIRSCSDNTIWHKSEVYDLYKRAIKKDKDEAESKQESEQPVHPQGDNPHFDFVYCRGTKDGKGVIEALEAHGGKNVYSLDGANSCYDYTYYIDPDGEITSFVSDQDVDRFILIKQFYTEIPPLTTET